jgi:dehydrogenase/reductase SDR family protein 4
MSTVDFSLKNKTVLVTGGSKGIGRAIALTFAEAGADIAIAARGMDSLEKTKKEIKGSGQRCIAVQADLSSDEQIRQMHETVVNELGAVDILINNAGIGYFVALADLTHEQFDDVIRVNTWAALYLSQLCYPAMKEKGEGVIVNMASTGGLKPDILAGSYSASKAGLIMLTKQIACEWGNDGIRCVAICPGLVRTEMAADLVAHRERNGFQNLVNRVGEPDEIAGMALVLASPAGGFCQGGIYTIDGGSMVSAG